MISIEKAHAQVQFQIILGSRDPFDGTAQLQQFPGSNLTQRGIIVLSCAILNRSNAGPATGFSVRGTDLTFTLSC